MEVARRWQIWMRRVMICIRHKTIRMITSNEVKSTGQVERPNVQKETEC
jgi:hypothetical protein